MNQRPSSEKHVLVIGGAGYIGSVLVRTMLKRGCRVRVLDALLYDNKAAIAELADNPRFSFIHGDSCRLAVLSEALREVTEVVLLAALVGDPLCKKYPDLARRVNDVGTINLIGELDGRGINRFVFISTCSNYGRRETDVEATEESELNPQSLYAETKVKVERHILDSLAGVDFSPTILRVATAYGLSPRMRFDLTINQFTRELAVENELLVYDADTWRPYCHVSDVCEAIAAVLEAPSDRVSGEVFNVGAPGECFTKRMIVQALLRRLPTGQVRFQEGPVDPRNYRVSFDKIERVLDFAVNWSLDPFLPELIEAIRAGWFADVDRRRWFYGNYSLSE